MKLSKPLLFTITLVALGSTLSIVIFALFNKQKVVNEPSQVTPTATIIIPTTKPTATVVPTVKLNVFQHKYLSGYSFNYPVDWKITIKEFKTTDDKGFDPTYASNCDEVCMGTRLSKNNVSLEFIFDVAFDDMGTKCSNTVNYTKLANKWFRFEDSTGIYYHNQVSLNYNTGDNGGPKFGGVNDEWSYVDNTTYKICIHMTGTFLEKHSDLEGIDNISTDGKTPILMEMPQVKGKPSKLLLTEIDQIILSIKGLQNPTNYSSYD